LILIFLCNRSRNRLQATITKPKTLISKKINTFNLLVTTIQEIYCE
jgi:hypothetical protein